MKVGLVSILRNRRYRLRTSWLAYKSGPPFRGVTGAFLDLEYQRIELLKFNLFDNSGTYKDYITGRGASAARLSSVGMSYACRKPALITPPSAAMVFKHAAEI